jgi:H+-transporting ATPase
VQVKDKEKLKQYQLIKFVPFNPKDKRTEATLKDPQGTHSRRAPAACCRAYQCVRVRCAGKEIRVTKGAPQVIVQIAANREEIEEEVKKHIDDFAHRYHRRRRRWHRYRCCTLG